MSEKRIQPIEFRLQPIQRALLEIGPMRPGSLTRHESGRTLEGHADSVYGVAVTPQGSGRSPRLWSKR